ncbi:putative C-_U-editing enzyme APOBEC-4 [Numida meleagris]|uniref:putative C->U-editing enzyme APOBEC-4 n=1 Tax=Numida meleagris TaxID=8996 RepID=UPI000B3DF7B4|nr:putative C->U-editing enzyme APOBEC-4 [Numida meleagris]
MNPGEKIFQEYLTNQGTVVKPYCWQTLSQTCAKCPYHIRTGEEARVPYEEFLRAFGFPYRISAHPQTHHLLFYELRSFCGTVVQKGHATSCAEQDSHPESILFEAGGYLDSVIRAHGNTGCITLYSNYSPCNEAYHCCISKIYNFLLKHPETTLCLRFSQPYHAEDSFPTAAWNRQALHSLASLWPWVTLQPLSAETWHHLLCNFVYGIPGSALQHPASPPATLSDQQNPHQINSRGVKTYCRKAFPQATQGEPAVQQNPNAFSFPRPAFQQPLPATKGSLPHPVSQSSLVLFPGLFLPLQRECLHPRPKNIVRHLKMPKELFSESRNPEVLLASKNLKRR